ncbi:MAG TPA: sulfotransferase [Woeseiaceae bacterium]|nr:sulfotransferase [Woeseiaceae bacterium]
MNESATGIRVIGAGVGRTGTHSLKRALEHLLGGRCYDMDEVLAHREHETVWKAAAAGRMPDWQRFLGDYAGTEDWPAAAFWPELAEAFPDAFVLLSHRRAEDWLLSARATIFQAMEEDEDTPWGDMIHAIMRERFTDLLEDDNACLEAYERHNAAVRAAVPPERLIDWPTGAGWEPLCQALGVAVPDMPFPHVNTTREFRERVRAH